MFKSFEDFCKFHGLTENLHYIEEAWNEQQDTINDLYQGILSVKESLDYLYETVDKAKELNKLVVQSSDSSDEPIIVEGEDARKIVLGMSLALRLISSTISFEKAE